MCEWNSIDKGLPEEEGFYLLHTPDPGHLWQPDFHLAWFKLENNIFLASGNESFEYSIISHWMLIVKPKEL